MAAMMLISGVVAVAQDQQCTEDNLNETYTKWYEPYKARDTSPQQKDLAYQIAKEYVNKCPNEFPDNPYAKALKSYVQVYEKAQATGKVGADFTEAIKKLNYKDILRTGKAYIAIDPNNSTAYLWMSLAGLSDPSLLSEAAQYAPKAIELVEAGKSVDPYKTKDQALASMNYLIAKSKAASAPTDAIAYFIKAAKYESDLKKDARLYNELAAAYGAGPVAKYAEQYQPFVGKTETNESKLVLVNYNQALDRQIDAMARATALADPANKKNFMDALTELYKARNKSEAGLNELVAGILSKPLPDMPTPITILPATSTSTPVGSPTGSPVGAAPTTNTGAKPATSNSAGGSPARGSATSTGTQSGGAAKPAASPTPKPRQRRANHRG